MAKEPGKIDIKTEMRVHIARKYKTQKAAAEAWGCSAEFVSAVLKGRKAPTPAMLNDAGFYMVKSPPQYFRGKA